MLSKNLNNNSDKIMCDVSTVYDNYMRKNEEKLRSTYTDLLNDVFVPQHSLRMADDVITAHLKTKDDDIFRVLHKEENDRRKAVRSAMESSDTNFFPPPVVPINEQFSRSERKAYYEMLVRDRNRVKTRKQIRKAANKLAKMTKTEAGDAPATVMDAFSNFRDMMADFIENDLSSYFLKDADISQFDFAKVFGLLGPGYESPVMSQVYLASKTIDLPWILHLTTTFLMLLESRNTYTDGLILTNYCAVGTMQNKNVVISAVLFPLMATIRSLFSMLKKKNDIKTESLSDFLYSSRSVTADFISSHLMMSIREIVLILSSYHLFPKKVAWHLTLWLGKIDKPRSLPEATSKIVTDIANVVRMGESLAKGVPLHQIFLDADPVMAAKKTMSTLLYEYNTLYYGLPVEGGYDAKDWVTKARAILESIRNIQKRSNPYDARVMILEAEMRNLTAKLVEVSSRAHRQKRVPPYLIILAGPPGIGKSSILTLLCQLWSKVKQRDFNQTHVFERCVSSQYWDGYDPWSNPIIHYSEVGALRAELAKMGQDKAVMELLSVCDSLPYSLDMAALESKGRYFCMPELVVLDTNNPGLNLESIVRNVAAFERRAIYVFPTVKDQFSKPNSCMLDANVEGRDIMDKWTFEVYRCTPQNAMVSTKIHLMRGNINDDIYMLARKMSDDMTSFLERESQVLEDSKEDWVSTVFPNGLEAETKFEVEDLVDRLASVIDSDSDYEDKEDLFDSRTQVESFDSMYVNAYGLYLRTRACKPYLLGKMAELRNAYGEPNPLVEMNSLCECCDFGVHVMTPTERIAKTSCDAARNMRNFLYTIIKLVIAFSMTLDDFSNNDLTTFTICIACLMSMWFIPYFWCVIALICFIYTAKCSVDKIYTKLGVTVKKVVLSTFYSECNHAYLDVKEYLRGKQSFIIRATLMTVALVTFAKAIPFLMEKYQKRKKIVESDFNTQSIPHKKLQDFEKTYCFREPEIRIKKNLAQKTYDNVLVTDIPNYTGSSLSTFAQSIRRNVRHVKCVSIKKGFSHNRRALILGIKGTYALVLSHYFDFSADSNSICIANDSLKNDDEYNYQKEMYITEKDVRIVATDIYLVRMKGVQFANILHHIASVPIKCKQSTAMINYESIIANDNSDIHSDDRAFNRTIVHKNVIKYMWEQHGDGQCGNPVLFALNGGCIIGALHVAGDVNGGNGYAVKIDRVTIEARIREIDNLSFPILSKTESDIISGGEPDSRSFTRYVDQGPVDILGKVHTFNGNQKNTIVESIFAEHKDIHDILLDNLPSYPRQIFAPAILGPCKRGSPITKSAIKICGKRKPVHNDILMKCVDVAFKHITNKLTELGVKRDCAPIDFNTVVNGHNEDFLARKVDMSKGGGFGYPGPKRNYMHYFPDDEIYEPNENLVEDMLNILKGYEKGYSSNPVFKASLKEEVRPKEKVDAFNTRTFYASSLSFLLVQKSLLGPLYTLMVEHSEAFCCALGIDMHRHGHLIKQTLVEFLDKLHSKHNFGEGDYGGFDTSMSYEIGEGASLLEYKLLEWLGYSPQQLSLLAGALTDAMFPRVDFFGDLLFVPGLQTSGKYGTAENNSLRNLLILLYCWYSTKELEKLPFFDNVMPVVYGDDVLIAIADNVAPLYNNITIARHCLTIGLEFTSSSKTQVLTDFVCESDISFLKRTYRFHPALERDVATLSLQSIEKMLLWIAPSKSAELHIQYEGVIRSACYEIFFWVEEREYSKIREYFIRVYRCRFVGRDIELPTYGDLVSIFLEE